MDYPLLTCQPTDDAQLLPPVWRKKGELDPGNTSHHHPCLIKLQSLYQAPRGCRLGWTGMVDLVPSSCLGGQTGLAAHSAQSTHFATVWPHCGAVLAWRTGMEACPSAHMP